MTVENSKKLYAHYVKIGYDKAAQDLLKKYPEFEKKAEVPKEEKKEEKEEVKKSK